MVFKKIIGLMMGCLGLAKHPTRPVPCAEVDQIVCNSPRIRLSDGRFLAYRERGVPKNKSNYRVIIVHGFGSSKEMDFMAPKELLDELSIYLLQFDRAGYGESDPNPKRSLNSESSDIEELADELQLGSKFYVVGVSVGCYPVWSCLRQIPNRLAGVSLVVPCINFKWPSLPDYLTKDVYMRGLSQRIFWFARYAPGLLHWWLTQKLFPQSSVHDRYTAIFGNKDLEVMKNTPGFILLSQNKLSERSIFDSLCRDFMVAFGEWDFDPLDLCDPFPQKESLVYIWQGCEDKVVPFQLQRYVSSKLPWISYHEVADGGHFLVYDTAVCEAILRSLLLGEDFPLYRPQL